MKRLKFGIRVLKGSEAGQLGKKKKKYWTAKTTLFSKIKECVCVCEADEYYKVA